MLSWALTFLIIALIAAVTRFRRNCRFRGVDRASSLRSVHNTVCLVLPLPRAASRRLMEIEDRYLAMPPREIRSESRGMGKNFVSIERLLV